MPTRLRETNLNLIHPSLELSTQYKPFYPSQWTPNIELSQNTNQLQNTQSTHLGIVTSTNTLFPQQLLPDTPLSPHTPVDAADSQKAIPPPTPRIPI